jgi:hypothetical protein
VRGEAVEILASSVPPLGDHRLSSFSDAFVAQFFKSSHVSMVAGYAAADAVVELSRLVEKKADLASLDLVVGMANFDGLFRSQLDALIDFHELLVNRSIGGVYIARALPVHAKASSFGSGTETLTAIVGSSNLSGLVPSFRQFEMDVLLRDLQTSQVVHQMIRDIVDKASSPISIAKQDLKVRENPNLVLEGVPGVSRVDSPIPLPNPNALSFRIPIKPEPKSHLNVFFGAGRKQGGYEVPRHWYEVELIVGVDITRKEGYPQAGTPEAIFDVITDDGWRFGCQVQGQNSKNFRSSGDLRILGKWIKERLQNAGALRIGEPVTSSTFRDYGRSDLLLTKLADENLWLLDFAKPNV